MKRDLYAEVSARIVAELEAGAAPWIIGKPRGEYAAQCREQPALLWLQRRPVVDSTSSRISHTALSHLQAGFGIGWQRPQGRARHEGLLCEATTSPRPRRG